MKYKLNSKHIVGTLETVEKELLQDDAFRLEWEDRQMTAAFAEFAREMRKEVGFSQVELAKKLSVPQPVIARLESRKPKRVPTLDTMARLAAACGRRMVVRFEKRDDGGENPPILAME